MKIFEVVKNPHSGVVIGVSIFGITISNRKNFNIWNRMFYDILLDNVSLRNKEDCLECKIADLDNALSKLDTLFISYNNRVCYNFFTVEQDNDKKFFGLEARAILKAAGYEKSCKNLIDLDKEIINRINNDEFA